MNFVNGASGQSTVSPLLQQAFLVGSGFTSGGEQKRFIVPAGATHLYLAVNEGVDNSGFFTVTVTPEGSATPTICSDGVVRAAGFQGGPVAPGSLLAIFGTDLADGVAVADKLPLSTVLKTTKVYFNLLPAPLLSVSQTQVNVQVPWELASVDIAQLVVSRNGAANAPITVRIAAANPGLFLIGDRAGVIVNSRNGALVDEQTSARRGDVLIAYASGLGPVGGASVSGAGASLTQLQPALLTVDASLESQGQKVAAPIQFAGMAPGFVGVEQVNLTIPQSAPSGVATLKLRSGNRDSNPVSILIE